MLYTTIVQNRMGPMFNAHIIAFFRNEVAMTLRSLPTLSPRAYRSALYYLRECADIATENECVIGG